MSKQRTEVARVAATFYFERDNQEESVVVTVTPPAGVPATSDEAKAYVSIKSASGTGGVLCDQEGYYHNLLVSMLKTTAKVVERAAGEAS